MFLVTETSVCVVQSQVVKEGSVWILYKNWKNSRKGENILLYCDQGERLQTRLIVYFITCLPRPCPGPYPFVVLGSQR